MGTPPIRTTTEGVPVAKSLSFMIAVIVGGHGLIGLFIEGEHMLGIFTVDIVLDAIYLGTAGLLLAVAVLDLSALTIRIIVGFVGVSYLALFLAGLADRQLAGAAPTGLTLMDDVLFAGLVAACAVAALQPRPELPLWVDNEAAGHSLSKL
jgi:hypothetical protein